MLQTCLPNTIMMLCIVQAGVAQIIQQDEDHTLRGARQLYYAAIDDQDKIAPAKALFEAIEKENSALNNRARVYLGGLQAIQAKHAFWPGTKVKWVKRALKTMDQGIQAAPDDLEARFVRGTICDNLPFFFGRTDDARQDFRYIASHLPDKRGEYDQAVVIDIVNYLTEMSSLNAHQLTRILELKASIKANEE